MISQTPRLLNVNEAADRLGVSVSYLNKLRMVSGAGPVFVRFGVRVAYDQADLNAWVDAQKRSSTGDDRPASDEVAP